MKECDVCGGKAEPDHLPSEKQSNGYDPQKENLCCECYQDKYWIKGEDY